jgi:AraC-like DNA-binding protein
MFLRVRQFIDANLDDIGLTPEAIAAAHFISLRTLQRLFADQDLTVACWIRNRRLEKCRDDLRNPLLAKQSVQAIGARWGFTDQAHFSRAFRRTYGMTPRSCRAERHPIPRLASSVNHLARID